VACIVCYGCMVCVFLRVGGTSLLIFCQYVPSIAVEENEESHVIRDPFWWRRGLHDWQVQFIVAEERAREIENRD
jgi:hypothetical protein